METKDLEKIPIFYVASPSLNIVHE